jgi:hypothetical protein
MGKPEWDIGIVITFVMGIFSTGSFISKTSAGAGLSVNPFLKLCPGVLQNLVLLLSCRL